MPKAAIGTSCSAPTTTIVTDILSTKVLFHLIDRYPCCFTSCGLIPPAYDSSFHKFSYLHTSDMHLIDSVNNVRVNGINENVTVFVDNTQYVSNKPRS